MIKILMIVSLLGATLWGQDVYATFNVQAHKESNLVLSATGLVKKINVDVGDKVKKVRFF